jgi:hypothetical protein
MAVSQPWTRGEGWGRACDLTQSAQLRGPTMEYLEKVRTQFLSLRQLGQRAFFSEGFPWQFSPISKAISPVSSGQPTGGNANFFSERPLCRWGCGRVLPLAEELTRLPVDLIATQGTATRLLLKVSTTVPGVYVLSVGCSIHQQHTKKKDQIEYRKHEQATSRPPFLVIASTHLP